MQTIDLPVPPKIYRANESGDLSKNSESKNLYQIQKSNPKKNQLLVLWHVHESKSIQNIQQQNNHFIKNNNQESFNCYTIHLITTSLFTCTMIYPHTYFTKTTRKARRKIKRKRRKFLKKRRILLEKLFKLKKLKAWRRRLRMLRRKRRKKKVTQDPFGYFSFDGVLHPNPSSVSPTIGCFDTNGIFHPYPKASTFSYKKQRKRRRSTFSRKK